jgi:hypothetical protein
MKTDEGGDIITRPIVLVYFVTIILFTLWIAAAVGDRAVSKLERDSGSFLENGGYKVRGLRVYINLAQVSIATLVVDLSKQLHRNSQH